MPILSDAAMKAFGEFNFWRGVEFAIGYFMNAEQRAAACVCAFLWWSSK